MSGEMRQGNEMRQGDSQQSDLGSADLNDPGMDGPGYVTAPRDVTQVAIIHHTLWFWFLEERDGEPEGLLEPWEDTQRRSDASSVDWRALFIRRFEHPRPASAQLATPPQLLSPASPEGGAVTL